MSKRKKPLPAPITPIALTVKDAAAYIASTVWFVRTLGWQGKLKPLRHGKRFVYLVAELDAYLQRERLEGAR